ncbi:MAG: hypothetical protein ACK5H2_07080 [Beutenbergiaceae bacterium]
MVTISSSPPAQKSRRGALALLALVPMALSLLVGVSPAYAAVDISGTVFDDGDGLSNAVIDGIGIGAAGPYGQLHVTAVSAGVPVASTQVAADGSYSLSGLIDGSYTVILSRHDELALAAPGRTIAPALPADWQYTGEGTLASGDGTPDGAVAIAASSTVNFGIRAIDSDGDGTPDSGELGSACWDITFASNSSAPSGDLTAIAHSGAGANGSVYGPAGTANIIRINGGMSQVSNLRAGTGLTLGHRPGGSSFSISNVSATTAEQAKSTNAYIEYDFPTGTQFAMAYVDWVGMRNQLAGQEAFDVVVAISENGGAYQDVATFNEAAGDGHPINGRENEDIANYPIARSSHYTVRYYFYNVAAATPPASNALDFDDPFLGFDVCPYVSLAGSVLHDSNGTSDGVVSGTGIGNPAGAALYATLVNQAGVVVASRPVAAAGTYNFGRTLSVGDYEVHIGTTDTTSAIGQIAPAVALPPPWRTVGEDCCDATGDDGTEDGIVPVLLDARDTTGVRSGIQQAPTANDVTAPSELNPGGTTSVVVPGLTMTDPEDGVPDAIAIRALATNGTLYYNGVPVTFGQVITGFDPALLTLDPAEGVVTAEFSYAAVDAAGTQSDAAVVRMPFDAAGLELVKSVDSLADSNGNGLADIGEAINYSFQVTNTGNVTISGIDVTDMGAVVSGGPIELAGGEADTTSFTAAHVITEADFAAGGVENTATVLATVAGNPLTDVSDAGTDPAGDPIPAPGTVSTDNPLAIHPNPADPGDDPTTFLIDMVPRLELIKSVSGWTDHNGNGEPDAGDVIGYAFTVTNVGNVPIADVSVVDVKADVDGGPITLAASESDATFTAEYTITAADVEAGAVENVARVSGVYDSEIVTDISDAGTAADGSEVDNPGLVETGNPLGEYDNTDDAGDDPTTFVIDDEILADTGAAGAGWWALAAVLLIGAGAGFLILRGRRTS